VSSRDEPNNSTDWALQARTRLALRRAEKPATKASQIRALWPDIEAALAVGQSMKTICAWLAEDAGIALGVTSLTSYISRIRRREAYRNTPTPEPPAVSMKAVDVRPHVVPAGTPALQSPAASYGVPADFDPLANFRASQAKNPGFHYRPATAEDEKDLI
jgi:hypothetical protein